MLQSIDYEVRVDMSTSYNVERKRCAADNLHSESAFRTVDYICESVTESLSPHLMNYVTYILAKKDEEDLLLEHSWYAPFTPCNEKTS